MISRDLVIDAFLHVDQSTRGDKEWDSIYKEISHIFNSSGIEIFSPGGSTNRRCIFLYSLLNDVEFTLGSKKTVIEYYREEVGLSNAELEEYLYPYLQIIRAPSKIEKFELLFNEVSKYIESKVAGS